MYMYEYFTRVILALGDITKILEKFYVFLYSLKFVRNLISKLIYTNFIRKIMREKGKTKRARKANTCAVNALELLIKKKHAYRK